MSQLVLSRGSRYRKSLFRKFFPNFQPGISFLVVSLIIFVALVTVITLMFSARQVTKGYVLHSLEAEHRELLRESERKDMNISKVRSLQAIESSQKVRRMVSPRGVVFVNGDSEIASR